MNTDSHYWIGSTHFVCEDYAISGFRDGLPYSIICDGCTSSNDTDFGARLLSRAAQNSLSYLDSENFENIILADIFYLQKAINIPNGSFDATLLAAAINSDNTYTIRIFGDGCIVGVFDDYIVITEIEYPSNAPFYLNYLADDSRLLSFSQRFGFKRQITHTTLYPNDETIISYVEDELQQEFVVSGEIDKLKLILITSDGIGSFLQQNSNETSKSFSKVSVVDVIKKLLPFKSYTGVFVKRRIKSFLRECEKLGWKNADDVSIGAIVF